MDNNMGLVEESRNGSDYVAAESKSLGGLVHINSIAIDIGSAMEEIESPVHEHFSIRGFVSRMREKDRKMCMAFVSEGDDDNLVNDLPPLFVPKFRWWQCSDCVPDIATDIGTRSCINVDGEKDCVIIHCTENKGKEDGSMDYGNGQGGDSSNRNLMSSKPSCTEDSKDKADTSDKEAGNTCHDIPEANNPLRIREKHNNIEGAADMAHVSLNPLCVVGEPDNGSDGTKSALMHRRKPKVRSLVDIMADNRIPTSNNSTDHLGLDVAADVAKGKRKFVFEEDEGPLVVEKTDRRVEISKLESERDACIMRLGEMSSHHRTKPRKRKALDISTKMINAPLTVREMGGSMLEQRIERISNFAKRKRSELVEADRDHLMPPPPSKMIIGDCSGKGKVALDLSLNNFMDSGKVSNRSSSGQFTSIIPDLNETFPDQMDTEQGNELMMTFSEKRSLDVSASCSDQEAARKGKRQLTPHEPQKPDKNIELEIVELLAKNQRARTHEHTHKHLFHETTNNSYQGSPALYFNGINNIPLANRNTVVRQNIPPNFPPLSNRQIEENQFRQYSASREDVFWTKSPFHLSNTRTHMGKTVSDIKGREGKTAIPVRSLDPYSNETIPAMQLLSLMDQRNVSSSSFKSFLQKPFAPTNQHHPRLSGNEHRKFGTFDSQNRNSKDLMGWRSGVYCAGESSKKASFHSQGQIPHERPARSNSPLGVCTLNRNPADFSVPDARNEFTISARDLKPRKKNVDGRKRQRVRKETSSR